MKVFPYESCVVKMHSLLYARDGSTTIKPPLSQAVGYVVVVGIGLAIALGTLLLYLVLLNDTDNI